MCKKAAKLSEVYGSEEVEENSKVAAIQKQMDEMLGTISGLAKSVSELVAVQVKHTWLAPSTTTFPASVSCYDISSNDTIDGQVAMHTASLECEGNNTPTTAITMVT